MFFNNFLVIRENFCKKINVQKRFHSKIYKLKLSEIINIQNAIND